MVFIADTEFNSPLGKGDTFVPFPLSNFQKWAIKAIQDGDHALITAHTGSGKTLPAEYMIKHFTTHADEEGRQRKKVIYASPIKALSNQKLYDMRRKFPEVSFGLLTGDCKDNPEADVLIMTTEILRNTLFSRRISQAMEAPQPMAFDMDVNTELGGVIFDEVHYINDPDRGTVWEQSIMLLPAHVQMLMLSATIANAEDFAEWIEIEKGKQAESESVEKKKVILAPTTHRVVPLAHYMWVNTFPSTEKKLKGTEYEHQVKRISNKMIPLKTADGVLQTDNIRDVGRFVDGLDRHRLRPRRSGVINSIVNHLKSEGKLPAICFVFSRKHVETVASEITASLFDQGDVAPSIVDKECRKILAERLPNFKEYIELPEYESMMKLLRKGVAIHHAGVMSVLREMVELLFDRGFIKLLVATETFAVGINMPTKTVIFTSLTKFDGNGQRPLQPHEYTQMAGRAGRRGIDTLGEVIVCSNMVPPDVAAGYKTMLCGQPPKLTSKFSISYNLLLNVIASGQKTTESIEAFVQNSMLGRELMQETVWRHAAMEEMSAKVGTMSTDGTPNGLRTDRAILVEIQDLEDKLGNQLIKMKQKPRKAAERRLAILLAENKYAKQDIQAVERLAEFTKAQKTESEQLEYCRNFFRDAIDSLAQFLLDNAFLQEEDGSLRLTPKGRVASQLQEVHPLAVADCLEEHGLDELSPTEIATFLSMFTQVRVQDEDKRHKAVGIDPEIGQYLDTKLGYYDDHECRMSVRCSERSDFHFDLTEEMGAWCASEDEAACQQVIKALDSKGIFLGDFVKAVLKMNNIADELVKVYEAEGRVDLIDKLSQVRHLTLKYVVTNQSLYV